MRGRGGEKSNNKKIHISRRAGLCDVHEAPVWSQKLSERGAADRLRTELSRSAGRFGLGASGSGHEPPPRSPAELRR